MFGFLKRLFGGAHTAGALPESRPVVTFDDVAVTCRLADGMEESVRWDDLAAVIVETNDTGPWGCDVLWLLVGRNAESGCVVPQGATGEQKLLERLQQLPGFDNESLIAAMGSVDNQRFVCWEARDASGTGG